MMTVNQNYRSDCSSGLETFNDFVEVCQQRVTLCSICYYDDTLERGKILSNDVGKWDYRMKYVIQALSMRMILASSSLI